MDGGFSLRGAMYRDSVPSWYMASETESWHRLLRKFKIADLI